MGGILRVSHMLRRRVHCTIVCFVRHLSDPATCRVRMSKFSATAAGGPATRCRPMTSVAGVRRAPARHHVSGARQASRRRRVLSSFMLASLGSSAATRTKLGTHFGPRSGCAARNSSNSLEVEGVRVVDLDRDHHPVADRVVGHRVHGDASARPGGGRRSPRPARRRSSRRRRAATRSIGRRSRTSRRRRGRRGRPTSRCRRGPSSARASSLR